MSEHLSLTSEPSKDGDKGDKNKKSRKLEKEVGASVAGLVAHAEGAKSEQESKPKRLEFAQLFASKNLIPGPKMDAEPKEKADPLAPHAETKPNVGKEQAEETQPASAESSAQEETAEAGTESVTQENEAEAEVSALGQVEKNEEREVKEQLLAHHVEAAQAEEQAAKRGSVEAEVAATDVAFLEAVGRNVHNGDELEEATAKAFPEVLGVEALPLPEAEVEAAPDGAQTADHAENEEATIPLEALDFPVAQNGDEDDPYAAAYGAGYTGGGAAGGYGGAGTVTTGFAGGYGGAGAPGSRPAMGRWRGAEADREPRVEVNGVASGLFVGGIVGYLLGRRRGRIKTEQKLLPVQRELEKRVKALNDHLTIREEQVRKLVRDRATEQKATAPVAETVRVAAPEHARQSAPSAEMTQRTPARAEVPPVRTEHARLKPEDVKRLELPKLEALAESIPVAGLTLKRVYEVGLIKEPGLRKVVEEYLRGGEVQPVLNEAILEQEKSYELDPMMNKQAEEQDASTAARGPEAYTTSGVNGSLDQHASTALASSDNPTQYSPANLRQSVSPALVTANIAALVVLAVLLVVLLIVWLTR